MAFDDTITEQDLDASTQQFLHGLSGEAGGYEPDLSVDGLSGGFFSRILGLFGIGGS